MKNIVIALALGLFGSTLALGCEEGQEEAAVEETTEVANPPAEVAEPVAEAEPLADPMAPAEPAAEEATAQEAPTEQAEAAPAAE